MHKQILIILTFAVTLSCYAAYKPLELPKTWKFQVKTAAYNPDDSDSKIGDFKKGLKVEVIKVVPESSHWLVKYNRSGKEPLTALIDLPDLSKAYPKSFKKIKPVISKFPLLEDQLESKDPWPKNVKELATRLFDNEENFEVIGKAGEIPSILRSKVATKHGVTWGHTPLTVDCDYSSSKNPKIIVEYWNKSDINQVNLQPFKAKKEIHKNLEAIESAFQTRPLSKKRGNKSDTGITAAKNHSTLFYLPNDIIASLRYKRDEYLILELLPYSRQEKHEVYNPATFNDMLLSKLKTDKDGNRHLTTIPMISQGNKGYCVAATIARVLNYYGYQVDMHSIADLAKTSRRGTTYKQVITSMRRICNSTPFKIKQIDAQKIDILHNAIDRGIPIIWLVPGHLRLLIGYNPKSSNLIYSDSWGAGHEFKTMSINDYYNITYETWILEPKD